MTVIAVDHHGEPLIPPAWQPANLGCARCGDCCSPVTVDFGVWTRAVADARRYGSAGEAGRDPEQWRNCVFLAAHCQPTGYRAAQDWVLLRCRFYDQAHQLCRAYADRPEMCSGFPWYGKEPPGFLESRCCSYLLDVPPALRPEGSRPLIPLTVV